MAANFLSFVKEQKELQTKKQLFTESFKTSEVDKVHDLMLKIFQKNISGKTICFRHYDTTIDSKAMRSYLFLHTREDAKNPDCAFTLNYLQEENSSEVYSICFFDKDNASKWLWGDENPEAALTISTLGTSVAFFIPIINKVVANKQFDLTKAEATDLAKTIYAKNESKAYYVGALKYNIFENLTPKDIDDMYHHNLGFIQERNEAQEYRWKKKAERDEAHRHRKDSADAKARFEEIDAEYRDILNAIRGGATTISEINMSVSKSAKKVKIEDTTTDKETVAAFNEAGRKSPAQAFKEMQVYVKSVIKGLQPGVILCGAPGIGKTYKVLQQLKANNYHDGHNMEIIKGKCTTRQLYLTLYEHKKRGEIVVIDDADALVGPKAPEECINILKAALDSTASDDGRKVSYRITGKLMDDEGVDVPKTFYYNGGVVVITNYGVGQLDTALRGRVFTQSLDFTTQQFLEHINTLLPAIEPGLLSMRNKQKAYDYLLKLANEGTNMEISIRTFGTCAKLYQLCEGDSDLSEEDVESMIKEQMMNQARKEDKHF